MENSIFKQTIVFTTNQNPMKKNYQQILMKVKTASSYARFFKSSVLKCSKTMLAFLFTLFFAGNLLAQSDFVTKWNLATNGSGATQLSFGVAASGSVNYTWEEVGGSSLTGSGSFSSSPLTITGLPTGATIRLRISPTNFQRINIASGTDRNRLLDVEQWGTTAWTSMNSAFKGCSNLNITATDVPNLSSVTDMYGMFTSCAKLNGPSNINSWNTSTVTNMYDLFDGCSIFNQNIGSWNTENVTTFHQMFRRAYAFNQNIGNWKTAKVTNMAQTFAAAVAFNQNLSNWTLNANVNMSNMLSLCGMDCNNYTATLIGWNSQSVTGRTLGATGRTYANGLAARAKLVKSVNTGGKGWTISNDAIGTCPDPTAPFITTWNLATTGSGATQLSIGVAASGSVNYEWEEVGGSGSGSSTFSGTSLTITGLPTGKTIRLRIEPKNFQRIIINNGTDKSRLLDVEQWGATAWTSMNTAFKGCSNLNITATDVPNLSSVTDMYGMFTSCAKLNGPSNINSWNTSTVTNMYDLFDGCSIFNQNIGSWNTENVTTFHQMFRRAYAFNQNVGNWKTAKVTNMSQTFASATAFNQNLGNWTLNANVNMSNMLNSCGMNCANYSATLIGWSSTSATGLTLGASGIKYGAYAAAARTTLTTPTTTSGCKGWTITDGGQGTCNDPRLTITTQAGLYDYQGVQVTEDAVNRTWVVTPSATISNAAITFEWTTGTPELTGFTRSSLGVYTRTSGYTGSGDWTLVNTGSATQVGTTTSYTTTVTGLTLNTGTTYYFGVTNSMTPLPVSIIDFKGFVKNDIINLNWKVTDEKELSRYDIYSSVDGINYSVCGSVSATVSETGIKTYQFQDLSNKSALVYYKIKAINNDETGEWSSIVALHTTKPVVNKPLKVYPNPATDFINLEFEGIVPSYFNVLIMDMSGKVVYQLDGVESESNQYTLPLNGIESGMYIVKLSDEFGNTTINRFNIK
jgi:surface protein